MKTIIILILIAAAARVFWWAVNVIAQDEINRMVK